MTQLSTRRHSKTWRWLISCGMGLVAGQTYYNHFVLPNVADGLSRGILLVYLAALFSALAYGLLFRLTLPKLQFLSGRARIVLVSCALAVGACLVAVVPLRPVPMAMLHRLEIVATGQKNPAAKASQVWFNGLYRFDGSQVAVSTFSSEGNWEMRDGMMASLQSQPATLHWEGMLVGDARVQFISHPWSGIVRIQWDDQMQTVDLYAAVEQNTSKMITLTADSPASRNLMSTARSVLVFGIDTITFGVVVLAASVWLVTKRHSSF